MYIRLRYPGAVACFKIENEMYHTVASIPSGGQATVNPGEKLLVRWADHLQLTGLLRLHGCGGPGKLLGTVMMVRGHSPPLKGPSGHRGWGGDPTQLSCLQSLCCSLLRCAVSFLKCYC